MITYLPDPKNQVRIVPIICAREVGSFIKQVALSERLTIFSKKK